jgi:hypothetical protein
MKPANKVNMNKKTMSALLDVCKCGHIFGDHGFKTPHACCMAKGNVDCPCEEYIQQKKSARLRASQGEEK